MNKKIFLKSTLTPILFVFLSVVCCLSLAQTSTYSLDELAYQISNYNSPYTKETCSYVKLKSIDKVKQHDFLKTLYYDFCQNEANKNYIYDFRQYCDNNIIYKLKPEDNLKLSFYSQSTFNIKKKNKKYVVDGGQFYSYYKDDILGTKGYLKVRGGCDSFVFISDKLADILVEKYGLGKYEKPYEELIKNKKYYVLPVQVDNKKELKFCINNILYTNKGTAPRYCQFNKNFALMKNDNTIKPNFDIAFELDLKFSANCITSTLKHASSLGYGKNDYTYEFYKNNKITNKYYFDKTITSHFKDITSEMDSLYITIFILILILGTFVFYLFTKKWKFDEFSPLASILILCFLLLIFSVVSAFIYIYPLFSICPIYLLIVYVILRRKEI